jgi:hypothetical protein
VTGRAGSVRAGRVWSGAWAVKGKKGKGPGRSWGRGAGIPGGIRPLHVTKLNTFRQ